MHNWDYQGGIQPGETGEKWKITRLALYGLGGEKFPQDVLKKYINSLDLPDDRKAFLQLLLQ